MLRLKKVEFQQDREKGNAPTQMESPKGMMGKAYDSNYTPMPVMTMETPVPISTKGTDLNLMRELKFSVNSDRDLDSVPNQNTLMAGLSSVRVEAALPITKTEQDPTTHFG